MNDRPPEVEVLALGGPALLVVAAAVTATFFGTQRLGRLFGPVGA